MSHKLDIFLKDETQPLRDAGFAEPNIEAVRKLTTVVHSLKELIDTLTMLVATCAIIQDVEALKEFERMCQYLDKVIGDDLMEFLSECDHPVFKEVTAQFNSHKK